MIFEDFIYQRPDIDTFSETFQKYLSDFDAAVDFEAHESAFSRLNELRMEFMSMYNLCYIRHTMDVTDKFYDEENNFYDNYMPQFQNLRNQFYQSLINSRFKDQLQSKWGDQLFALAYQQLKTFKPEIQEDLVEENQLGSEYTRLKAGAKIVFEGDVYNLSSIHIPETSRDRETRKSASETKWQFFTEQQEKFDEIFDKLVKTRHRIAQKLGFENFVELGYARMQRTDYTPEMVARFRDQVKEHIVPIANSLYARQVNRLGLESLKYFDEEYKFTSGNPKPKGSPDWIIENASKMYSALAPETETFFNFMRQNNLMDLVTRPGKSTGGYCTYIGKYKAPFIFSNFTGTSADIDVLTHEAGHAFQVFSSRDLGLNEYNWPTYEACEIHSMSMEFFTWPWMDLFFKEDADKYKFSHLASSITFLPYGVAVDEFQHYVYENPEVTPKERKEAWKAIEKKYLPHRDYADNSFLEAGGFWQKQSHIFVAPFYYIDYTLAQVCAFQFWKKDREDHEKAWKDYLNLCKLGGSKPFLALVKEANLQSPFEEGGVKSIVFTIRDWLDAVDDSTF
ncbi:MAG: M3 family oligoendopeptidase [Bacteroidetes bacterium]|nr:MAG: M3 family oligoendopeptidase [Bacteroidota bacterium]